MQGEYDMIVSRLLGGAALAALATCLVPAAAHAQTEDLQAAADADDGVEQRANEVIVTGNIAFRNRTADPNPVLSYDLEYFQKFEPVSVGEMLKRVPGVTFTSDVLEYDQPQFRGLPAGYTQVLINGRRAPGAAADRSFYVDRIPAELVERIEIVRAPRADQPSEGVAGTLNVVTKEGASFEGGFLKGGALLNTRDGVVRPSIAGAYAGRLDEATDFWAAVNYQERRNPKEKVSYRFADTPTADDSDGFPDGLNSSYVTDPEFDNYEAQSDTRDGSDLSGNAEITTRFGEGGHFRIGGFFVDTDRDEDETSLTYEGADLDFDGAEVQHEEISQQTYAITADALIPIGGLKLGIAGAWNGYRDNTDSFVSEGGEEDLSDLERTEIESTRIKDDEYSGTLFLRHNGGPLEVKAGIDFLSKKRTGSNSVFDVEDDESEENPAATFTIEEKRYDPYIRLSYEPTSQLSVDAGLRYEITDRDTVGNLGSASYNAEMLNPSLHLRFAPTARDQFRASIARTVRRPSYDFISPYEQEESPGDDDITFGNPALRNERAWGIDMGYERRLGEKGIVGINFFYRDITDLIELVSIGDVTEVDEDDRDEDGNVTEEIVIGNEFTPRNIGDGQTWGFEVDFSAPVNLFSFGETGLFANYTYLDSKTIDPFTGEERRFNNQPHHVYNAGFIQNVEPAGMSFGATVSGRSGASESNFDETIDLRYTPDLEAFVEKRFGRNFVFRISAQNLLDRVKKEDFRKYDGDSYEEILENRAAGDLDEYEIEREHSGPLVQFTLRAAF
jgi:outer membrane receptor protein involved in Fe transport